jgi:uncharacterized protein (TIGR02145 family)
MVIKVYLIGFRINGNKCPQGWHVPTDAKWITLTDYLGGESVAGGKLKASGTVEKGLVFGSLHQRLAGFYPTYLVRIRKQTFRNFVFI